MRHFSTRNLSLAFNPLSYRGTRALVLVSALAGSAVHWGCSASHTPGSSEEAMGSIAVRLSLPDGTTLSSLEYRITGNGIVPIAGSVPLTHSTTASFRVGSIPAGEGYTITVTSTTSDGEGCRGSATFDVVAGELRPVSVAVLCDVSIDTGDIQVDVEVNRCARVIGISALPLDAEIGSAIELSADASIADASFAWEASAGELADAGSPSTTYTCTEAGEHALSVAVLGGGPLCAEPDMASVIVRCAGSTTTLGGKVLAGPVRGATVQVFALSDGTPEPTPVATATTAPDGSYHIALDSAELDDSSEVLVLATGGVYCAGSPTTQVDESGACATGRPATVDIPLLGLARLERGADHSVILSPGSTAAAQGIVVGDDGTPAGTLTLADYETRFASLADDAPASATLDVLRPLLDRISAMQRDPASSLAQVVTHVRSGILKGALAVQARVDFDVVQWGAYDLTGTSAGTSGASRYFLPREGIDLESLIGIMEDPANGTPIGPTPTTIGADVYRGYPLADVVVRASRFRPMGTSQDSTRAIYFGGAASIAATSEEGRVAVYSFAELIRSVSGSQTMLVYARNGEPLPASEGSFAVLAPGDDDPWLRYVPRLKALQVRNDYDPTRTGTAANPSYTSGTPEFVRVPITGQVRHEITVTADTLGDNGLYKVDRVGDEPVSDFPTYHFQNLGPSESVSFQPESGRYYWGQGIRLTDVLDVAGLRFPEDKGACFVVIDSRSKRTGVFSCGELYNSRNGRGDGLPGGEHRSRNKGVLLVTDDFRIGSGTGQLNCTVNTPYESCSVTGDPASADSYRLSVDSQNDLMNDRFIALVHSEDTLPFTAVQRWFYWRDLNQYDYGIAPSERYQLGITTIKVIYVGPDGAGNGTDPTSSTP